jgi:membrane protein DedA with SNARE-associated domain
MSSKTQKLHHRREVHFVVVAVIFIVVIAIGMQFNDVITFSNFIGLNNFQESVMMLFEEGFIQFGILAAFVYSFLPVTLMKLGITGIVVRILDLGVSPLFLVLFFALGRLVGQGILYAIGRFVYRLLKGKDRELATADHFLHKYKFLIYLLTPLLGSIGDLIMLVSGHQRIGFMRIAPILYVGNVISTGIWIYWTVTTINLPALFT